MYDHSLDCGRKHFCCYYLHTFTAEDILKCHIKYCFKFNGRKIIIMPKKGEYVKFKNFKRKIDKIIIHNLCVFWRHFFLGDNGNQNVHKINTKKYQKHVACSYTYKLECVDDKFGKSFKSYLDEDAVYNFISSMIKESKYCSDMMTKHFSKELVMTKEGNEIVRTLLNVESGLMITLILMLT